MSWIQTYKSNIFDLFEMNYESIDIEDIAHALSLTCRYGGHCNSFYSVAEHSVRMSEQVPEKDAFWALMHDAAEAYLGDIPAPFKLYFRIERWDSIVKDFAEKTVSFEAVENMLLEKIADLYGLQMPIPKSVKIADRRMAMTEKRDLLKKGNREWNFQAEPYKFKIRPWTPQTSEIMFMKKFKELKNAVESQVSSN